MTKSDFFNLVLKVIGLYFFILVFTGLIQFIIMIINSLYNDFDGQFWLFYGGTTINLVFYLFFGYTLVFKTETVGRILKLQPEHKEFKLTVDKVDLIEIAIVAISIVAIVFSIPRIAGNLTEIIYFPARDEFGHSEKSFDNYLYSIVFQLAIGIIVLLNARNFSKMIYKRGIKDDEFDKKTRANNGE